MANCPKCGVHLRPLHWAPKCPKCGVNIMYFDMEQRLAADADRAEAQAKRMGDWGRRVKEASIGSLPARIRLCSCVVPMLCLLLPFAKGRLVGLHIENTAISIITVIRGLFGGNFNTPAEGKLLLGALLLPVLALCALGGLAACAFAYGRRGKGVLFGFLGVGLGLCFLAGLLLVLGGAAIGAGFFAAAFGFAACIVIGKVCGDKINFQ